jgi:hypothetical protein
MNQFMVNDSVITSKSLLIKDKFVARSNACVVATAVVTDTMSMKERISSNEYNEKQSSINQAKAEFPGGPVDEVFEDKRLLHNNVSDVWKNKIVNQK